MGQALRCTAFDARGPRGAGFSAELLTSLALAWARAGSAVEAEAAARAALALDPEEPAATMALGLALMAQDRPIEARAALEQALAAATDARWAGCERSAVDREARLSLAQVLVRLGDLAGAREVLQQARTLHPDDDALAAQSIRLEAQAGAPDAALAEGLEWQREHPSRECREACAEVEELLRAARRLA